MKQLVVLSGKGGTGKTSVAAALAHLSNLTPRCIRPVLVDADVDAANLGLVLNPTLGKAQEFWGASLAEIDANLCSGCGACGTVCRYDAIYPVETNSNLVYQIDPIACDGCAACMYACPEGAITMVKQQEGVWMQSKTPYGDLFHAELFAGRENSGKLVTLIKQQARLWAEDSQSPLIIIDGPPGIGCPVISACAGVDMGLVVAEPGLAGLHDMRRVLETLQHFQIPTAICINKADIYPQGTKQIHEFAGDQGLQVLGEIPFDDHIPQSIINGTPITDLYPETPSSRAIQSVWEQITEGLLITKG